MNSLSKNGANERTGKHLAPKTIRHNPSFVSDMFAYAVKMGGKRQAFCEMGGIHPTTVSGILGHSQVSTTLNLYSHMFRENQIKAADSVANVLSFLPKRTM